MENSEKIKQFAEKYTILENNVQGPQRPYIQLKCFKTFSNTQQSQNSETEELDLNFGNNESINTIDLEMANQKAQEFKDLMLNGSTGKHSSETVVNLTCQYLLQQYEGGNKDALAVLELLIDIKKTNPYMYLRNNPNTGTAVSFIRQLYSDNSLIKSCNLIEKNGTMYIDTINIPKFDGSGEIITRKLACASVTNEFLDNPEIFFHEICGHLIHYYVNDYYIPSNVETLLTNATNSINAYGTDKLFNEIINFEHDKVNACCEDVVKKEIIEKYGSEEEFINLYTNYINARAKGISHSNCPNKELIDSSIVRYNQNKFRDKSVNEIIDVVINSIKSETYDDIMRKSGFTDFEGILASASSGYLIDEYNQKHPNREGIYGHVNSYYAARNKDTQPYSSEWRELVAMYGTLRLSGNVEKINLLRTIVGNELIDELDKTYTRMIYDRK